MKSLISLTIAATKRYLRSYSALIFTLIFPIALLAVFGAISNNSNYSVDIGLVNNASTPQSVAFVKELQNINVLKIEEGNEGDERSKLDNGKKSVVIIIPNNFGEKGSVVELLTNANKQQDAEVSNQIITQILNQGFNYPNISPNITINEEQINSKNLTTIDFLTPGLIAQSIMQLGIFGVAFAFVSQKATGVLKRVLATPAKPWEIIIAEGFSRVIISMIQIAILITLSSIFFKLHVVGSLLGVFGIALLGIIIFLSLGFAIAGYAKDENQVPPIANLLFLPMFLLSGVFFSRDIFPSWLKTISDYFPLTYLVDAMREVMNNGSGIDIIGHDIIGLVVWVIFTFFIAYKLFKWE